MFVISEWGGDSYDFINYVVQRDNCSKGEAIRKLADVVDLKSPNYNKEDVKKIKEVIDRNKILLDANNYFTSCLNNTNNEVKNYLNKRGYSDEVIKKMGVGYKPSKKTLYKHLTENKKCDKALVTEIVGTIPKDTHNLTIPFISGGNLKGFNFRITKDIKTPSKYLLSKKIDKTSGFFNIKQIRGDKDLIIVEGELDCLHLKAIGVNNVVATGGNNIALEQIQDAIKKGTDKFTICFDNDLKPLETYNKLNKAINIILSTGINNIYIAILPPLDGKKTDPDSFILSKGKEALNSFEKIVKKAISYYRYNFNTIANEYLKIVATNGKLTDKERGNLLNKTIKYGGTIVNKVDRESFHQLVDKLTEVNQFNITKGLIKEAIEKQAKEVVKFELHIKRKEIYRNADALMGKGQINEAFKLLENGIKNIEEKTQEDTSKLFKHSKWEDWEIDELSTPQGLESGYVNMPLAPSALTLFVALSSHGKTAMMVNLLVNTVKLYEDKQFYLFSLEEGTSALRKRALNVYLDRDLSNNNTKTISSFIKSKTTKYIRDGEKENFYQNIDTFKGLVNNQRLNIQYETWSLKELITSIKHLHKTKNVGAVFIDYIQKIEIPNDKRTRHEQVKTICEELRKVVLETNIPIVAGAQFNREVLNHLYLEARRIAEGISLEQIADTIYGLWNNKKEPSKSSDDKDIKYINDNSLNEENTIYVKPLKNRYGSCDFHYLLDFNPNTNSIKNKQYDITKYNESQEDQEVQIEDYDTGLEQADYDY